jgi:Holliday junction resolvase RusA-like endonuclease
MEFSHTFAIEPPPTHQAALRILKSKATGKMFVGKMAKSSAKKWSNAFTLLAKAAWKGKPPVEEVPLSVTVVFMYPKLKSAKEDWALKITRPDLDNLAKSTLDALTDAGWWKDDSLICDLRLVKAHGPTPSVMVSFNDIVLVDGEEFAAAKKKLTKD